jgi:hypothetical protein
MMSGRLSVRGPEPASEIVVRDDALRVVFAAPSDVTVEVPPGIYRVDVWVPGTTDVGLVAIRDGQDVTHDRRHLVADSVIPLTGVRTANEQHSALAQQVVAEPLHRLTGPDDPAGRLLLFTRSAGAPRFAAPQISILDLPGRSLLTLHEDGRVDGRHGCAGISADLPPGHYILSHRVPELGNRAQLVRVLANYETQIFAPWAEDHVDLAAAVISMPPLGAGFDPADQVRYLGAEHAAHALATGRPGAELDNPDPLVIMMTEATRLLDNPGDAQPAGPLARLWTDLEVLQYLGAGDQRGLSVQGPPILDAAVARLSELPDLDRLGAAWPAGLLSASTSGSVWARWDLDAVPVAAGAEPAPTATGTTSAAPPTSAAEVRPSQRLSRLRVAVPGRPDRQALAAAEAPTISFGRGQQIDVAVWAPDDQPSEPPRAEIRVRIGLRARIYQRRGEPVWYQGTQLPRTATDAVDMTVNEGENLVAHLAQMLRFGPED